MTSARNVVRRYQDDIQEALPLLCFYAFLGNNYAPRIYYGNPEWSRP